MQSLLKKRNESYRMADWAPVGEKGTEPRNGNVSSDCHHLDALAAQASKFYYLKVI